MKLVTCEPGRHGEAIRAIFNEAIVNSTFVYDYKPREAATMAAWFEMKSKGKLPVIGLENDEGELMGFASYGAFRTFPAYKYTVEHSVYVDSRFRRRGVGRRLLREIIALAEAEQYHLMVGVIDSANVGSIALHEEFGFTLSGTIREVGFKFGHWLDLVFYQLVLKGPKEPVDG
jgi:L-amino acid N-acyltransferase YncA